MKKSLAMLLVLCLLIGSMAIPAFSTAEGDWLTLRIECFDRAVTGLNIEHNMQTEFAQKNFGDPNHIKLEFVPVGRWSETEILNTWLAGGTAPDICFTYDSGLAQQYVNMDGLYPLDDLLAQYGQDLVAFLGSNVLEYGQKLQADGTKIQYMLPARRISVAKLGVFIRGDWLEKLGMKEPTNVDEWVEYLRAAKAANLGGDQTVPYCLRLYPNAPLFSNYVIIDSFLDFKQITKEDWFSLYHEMMPGAKEAFRLLNTLYNEGLVSENFAIDNGDIRDRDMNQGYAGFYIEGTTQVWPTYSDEMKKAIGDGAYWIPINPFVNACGLALHENYAANGMNIFIPSWVSEETAAAAIKYLNWMAQTDNMFFVQQGIEGINFDHLDEDGLPVGKKTNDQLADEYKMSGDFCFISNGSNFGSEELNIKYQAMSMVGYEDVVAKSIELMTSNSYAPVGYTVDIQAEADYGQMVLSKQAELLVNTMTCAPADFDKTFDACIQAILDVGGQEIINERRAAFQAGQIRGEFPPEVFGFE